MKKKIVFMMLIITFMLLIVNGITFGICWNCQDLDHDACTSKKSSAYHSCDSTWHAQTCCCGEDINKFRHDYGSWTYKDSTWCRKTCGTCYHYESAEHSGGTATCTSGKVCSRCGSEYTSALSHSYSSSVTTAATCTTDGVRTYRCSSCGNSYTRTISATDHSTTSSTWVQEEEVHYKNCSTCGVKVTSTEGEHVDSNGDGKCDTCEYVMLSAPTVTMAFSDGSSYDGSWTTRAITVTLNADNATSYEQSTDGGTTWTTVSSLVMNGTTGTATYTTDISATIYYRTVKNTSSSPASGGNVIKIDKTAPTGTITINKIYGPYVNSNEVTININISDNLCEASETKVALMNNEDFINLNSSSTIEFENYSETKTFTLTAGEGKRKVYAIFKDAAGNQSLYLVD